ncbi:hypothetical protein H6B14_06170 [Phocaeicola coprophilus]|nr:hypothetical protein [Phocaeicola coprophilus]
MEEKKLQVVTVKCGKEGCGATFKCQFPKSIGTYKVKCPVCGHENYVQFKAADIKMEAPQESAGQETAATIECPYGCGQKFKYNPKENGEHEVRCPNKECAHVVCITVDNGAVVKVDRKHTVVIDPTSVSKQGRLTIVRHRGLLGKFGKKSYPLKPGSNIIGREDASKPSDISIKGDSYMSRQSINIEVILQENGYQFKMTVLNAANPVMHNNRPLVVGEIIYLNFGDSIRLGNTTFNFEKA